MAHKKEGEGAKIHHEQWLKNEFIELILSAKKKFEIRPADDDLAECQAGDTITFQSNSTTAEVSVLNNTPYHNLQAYLDTNPDLSLVVGQSITPNQAKETWNRLYKNQTQANGPIVVIEIETI